MQLDISDLKVALVNLQKVPKSCEACEKRARYRTKRIKYILGKVVYYDKRGKEETECGWRAVEEALEEHFVGSVGLNVSANIREICDYL